MRLFKGEPIWTPYNRSQETDVSEKRSGYLKQIDKLNRITAYVLDTKQPVSKDFLASLGVSHWKVDTKDEQKLNFIRKQRGYTYSDIVTVHPDHLPNYEEKIKHFFAEHIHTDDEIRYFLEGSGYFDVRGHNDEWIRIHCKPTDIITLPTGIYHRYAPDENHYAKVMRLFIGDPVWTPHNRGISTDSMTARTSFLSSIESKQIPYRRQYITIEKPSDFDAIVNSLDLINDHNQSPIVLYFTAANDPATGLPWCPDARKAKPLFEQVQKELDSDFILLTIPIVRSEYKDNPDYFYRIHPGAQLKKIPTLAIWKSGRSQRQLIESELHDIEKIRSFMKFDQLSAL